MKIVPNGKIGGKTTVRMAKFIKTPILVFFILFLIGLSPGAFAETPGSATSEFLPDSGYLEGWAMEGKTETFSRENLFEHINGEAEMYLPYGFDLLTTAYYGNPAEKTNLSAEIYRMGSMLDAFGIYSNYRDPDDETVKIGTDGIISDSNLIFYQDRFFVRLAASGKVKPVRKAFIACAEALSMRLPGPKPQKGTKGTKIIDNDRSEPQKGAKGAKILDNDRPIVAPEELGLLKVPGILPRTEKYAATGLLGYKFFPRGLSAEAMLDGITLRVFVVITDSETTASATLSLFFDSLKKDGCNPNLREPDGKTLTAHDPLYKGIAVRQSGRYLLGIAKLEDPAKGIPLLDHWASSLP